MSKEKKPQRASDSARKSSRGASKRPASSEPKSTGRKRNDKETRKRRKTEKAVRKASARSSQRTKSSQSKTSKRNSTKRNSSSQSSQRKSPSSKTSQRTTSKQRTTQNQQRKKTSSQRNRAATTRNRGASVRSTQNATKRKRPSQGASVRKGQAVKRKLTSAEIEQRKRRRRLIIITVLLLLLLILGLFTLHYVSNRIQDQSTVVLNDEQKSFAPIACTPENVDVNMKIDAPLEEKTPITFTVTLRNTSRENPCYIDIGRGNTELEITSGETSIVQLTNCDSAGDDYKQLLIDRDMTTTFELKWNRHRGNECSAKSPMASPGTYHAVWSTKGKAGLEAKGSFELVAPPEPEPEKSDEDKDKDDKSKAASSPSPSKQ